MQESGPESIAPGKPSENGQEFINSLRDEANVNLRAGQMTAAVGGSIALIGGAQVAAGATELGALALGLGLMGEFAASILFNRANSKTQSADILEGQQK
jgi:hypothetical protein